MMFLFHFYDIYRVTIASRSKEKRFTANTRKLKRLKLNTYVLGGDSKTQDLTRRRKGKTFILWSESLARDFSSLQASRPIIYYPLHDFFFATSPLF